MTLIPLILGLLAQHIVPVLIGAAGLIGLFFARRSGVKSERDRNKAEKADAYEKHLKDIADAADARNSVSPGSMQDDPYRRD